MLVGLVASAVDRHALFVERELFVNAVAVTLNVAMQVGDVLSNNGSLGIEPGTIADTIPGIYRRLAAGGSGAEVRPPGSTAGPRSLGERLAVPIGSRQTAEIGSIPGARAGNEEPHGLRGLLGSSLPERRKRRAHKQCRGKAS